jgi:hypothetical protein
VAINPQPANQDTAEEDVTDSLAARLLPPIARTPGSSERNHEATPTREAAFEQATASRIASEYQATQPNRIRTAWLRYGLYALASMALLTTSALLIGVVALFRTGRRR